MTDNETKSDDMAEEMIEEGAAGSLRLVEDEDGVEVTVDQIVEAVLFSSDGPLVANRIAAAVGAITPKQVRESVERLNAGYEQANRSFQIEHIAGGYQMLTRPEYAVYLQRLYKVRSESRLSTAALETLAVVAYKQPVVRAEVEAIRGVASGEMLRSLMEKGLIRIVGRAEELGRPMLYGTTKRFLEIFGLRSIEDLPKVPELALPGEPATDAETDETLAESAEQPTDATAPQAEDTPPESPEEPEESPHD